MNTSLTYCARIKKLKKVAVIIKESSFSSVPLDEIAVVKNP